MFRIEICRQCRHFFKRTYGNFCEHINEYNLEQQDLKYGFPKWCPYKLEHIVADERVDNDRKNNRRNESA